MEYKFGFAMVCMLSGVYGYDHLKLVQTWPQSFCQVKYCISKSLPRYFTIHGLWPDFYQARSPLVNCKALVGYVPFTDPTFLDGLDYAWPDLTRSKIDAKSFQKFWSHEWRKHGTCCFNKFNQIQYFEKTLELKGQFNVLNILSQNGITPGPRKLVNSTQVIASIATVTKYDPRIRCEYSRGSRYLAEVVICFDALGVSVVRCPQPLIHPSCGAGQIYFP